MNGNEAKAARPGESAGCSARNWNRRGGRAGRALAAGMALAICAVAGPTGGTAAAWGNPGEAAAGRAVVEDRPSSAQGEADAAEQHVKDLLEQVRDRGQPDAGLAARELMDLDAKEIAQIAAHAPTEESTAKKVNELNAVRRKAVANINTMEKGPTVVAAHDLDRQMKALKDGVDAVLANRWKVIEMLARRPGLVEKAKYAGKQMPTGAEEAKLVKQAQGAAGMTAAEAAGMMRLGEKNPPTGAVKKEMWFFKFTQEVDAFNAKSIDWMNRRELEMLSITNAYRVRLGLMPLEGDVRLAQSARRHSKEMKDLNYFSHFSPTAGLKEPFQRMQAAGYGGREYGENICSGPRDAAGAFLLWFNSPPHHQEMTNPRATALGVGNWEDEWTQNFGFDKRLMGQGDEARANVKTKGEVLPPQREEGERKEGEAEEGGQRGGSFPRRRGE